MLLHCIHFVLRWIVRFYELNAKNAIHVLQLVYTKNREDTAVCGERFAGCLVTMVNFQQFSKTGHIISGRKNSPTAIPKHFHQNPRIMPNYHLQSHKTLILHLLLLWLWDDLCLLLDRWEIIYRYIWTQRRRSDWEYHVMLSLLLTGLYGIIR